MVSLLAHKAQNRFWTTELLTMPWDKKQHCSARIEGFVGLRKPNITVPRKGDRNAVGDFGANMIGSQSFQQGWSKEEAVALWAEIPAAVKTNPATVTLATVLSKTAQLAEETIPPGCLAMLNDVEPKPELAQVACTFGGPLVIGHTIAPKFISFLFLNMDNEYRVKWTDLTGQQQYEWYEAWERCECTYDRVENQTRGLMGTDVSTLTTADAVEDAMILSPSLGKRRPDAHPVDDATWNAMAKRLSF
jgi:hypothetical protein